MKKILVFIVALFYLSSTFGATIHLHYCMGKLRSWDVFAAATMKCAFCGMEKADQKGCCHDEQKQVQVEKDQQLCAGVCQLMDIPAEAIIQTPTSFLPGLPAQIKAQQPVMPHPPGPSHIAIFIRCCDFRL